MLLWGFMSVWGIIASREVNWGESSLRGQFVVCAAACLFLWFCGWEGEERKQRHSKEDWVGDSEPNSSLPTDTSGDPNPRKLHQRAAESRCWDKPSLTITGRGHCAAGQHTINQAICTVVYLLSSFHFHWRIRDMGIKELIGWLSSSRDRL